MKIRSQLYIPLDTPRTLSQLLHHGVFFPPKLPTQVLAGL